MQHYPVETTHLSRLSTCLPVRERRRLLQQAEQYPASRNGLRASEIEGELSEPLRRRLEILKAIFLV